MTQFQNTPAPSPQNRAAGIQDSSDLLALIKAVALMGRRKRRIALVTARGS
ncbi:MAG: hypothetical protein JW699_04580 [Chitinispirillaceae bacterium]|nr:hypothetical protein [Chitinispirillaceae bacterium]